MYDEDDLMKELEGLTLENDSNNNESNQGSKEATSTTSPPKKEPAPQKDTTATEQVAAGSKLESVLQKETATSEPEIDQSKLPPKSDTENPAKEMPKRVLVAE